ncbi:MAG: tetratricopeptide repeat protein, partial [bacterium]
EEVEKSVEQKFAKLGVGLSENQRQRLVDFLLKSGEEYRTASVMFMDISGYTRICEKLKSEYVEDILHYFYRYFAELVEFYNGFVVNFLGDGGLAVFGAPVAYDRDAEAAVLAAYEIRSRVRALPVMHGEKIQVSGSVATGEILSSIIRTQTPPLYKIYGPAINLSARIEALAPPDILLIDPATQELVKSQFALRELPARKLKNIKHPVATFEVMSRREVSSLVRRDFQVPFVGRESQVSLLADQWNKFSRTLKTDEAPSPASCGVVIRGVPGIGKTRLATEFAAQHKDESRLIHIENAPYVAKAPWGMWRSVLAGMWKGSTLDSPKVIRKNLEGLLESAGIQPADQMTFKALFGLPEALKVFSSMSPELLHRLIAADLRRFIERQAASQPIIFILDDLQWADRTSLDLLNEIISPQPPKGIFLILSHRSGFSLKLPGAASFPVIHLNDLDEASRQNLLNSLVDVKELVPEVQKLLSQRVEGNPFYLVEMVRTLRDNLLDKFKGMGREEIAAGLKEWIPTSLKEIIQSRVDQLDPRKKAVLQCASVLGRQFEFQIIELFDAVRDDLSDQLHSLKTMEFLDESFTSGKPVYCFRQHFTREVIYQSMLERQRREYHHKLADALETKFSRRLEDYYPMLAHHYEESGLDEKTLRYMQLSGDRATVLAATHEAVEYYEKALGRLASLAKSPEYQKLEIKLRRSKGRIHRVMGDQDSALSEFSGAVAVARQVKSMKNLAILQTELGLTHIQRSNHAEAEKLLGGALSLVVEYADRNLRGMTLNGLGVCAWGRGDLRNAYSFFTKTKNLRIEKENPNLAADAHNNLALIEMKKGKLAQARKTLAKALQLRRRSGDRFGITLTLMNIAIVDENMGRYAVAERQYRNALGVAEEIYFAQLQAAVHVNLSNLFLAQKRTGEAMEHGSKALQIAKQIGERRTIAVALENVALAEMASENYGEARKKLDEAFRIARRIGDQERLLSLELARIEIFLSAGAGEKMIPRLKKVRAELEKAGFETERPRLLRLIALARVASGQREKAALAIMEARAEARGQSNRLEEKRIVEVAKGLR